MEASGMKIEDVEGIGATYATKLADAAVTLQEVVAARPGIVRRVPSQGEVEGRIAQSTELPKVIEH
jgi:hypothetical protein